MVGGGDSLGGRRGRAVHRQGSGAAGQSRQVTAKRGPASRHSAKPSRTSQEPRNTRRRPCRRGQRQFPAGGSVQRILIRGRQGRAGSVPNVPGFRRQTESCPIVKQNRFCGSGSTIFNATADGSAGRGTLRPCGLSQCSRKWPGRRSIAGYIRSRAGCDRTCEAHPVSGLAKKGLARLQQALSDERPP